MNSIRRLVNFFCGRAPTSAELQASPVELAKYLPENPIIVEAGAHSGQDTVRLASQWRKGELHAFEPVPDLCAVLQQNVKTLPNVRCHELALSFSTGYAHLHLSQGGSDGSSSLLSPDKHLEYHPGVQFPRTITVRTVTLDEWAAAHRISAVDLLWLDLQGMEPHVLEASPIIFSTAKVVHTEVSLVPVYSGTKLYPAFRVWMEARGFVVAREFLPYPDMGNVLFVRDK